MSRSRAALPGPAGRGRLMVEAGVLFAVLPLLVALLDRRGSIFPVLWVMTGLVAVVLTRDPSFSWRRMWGAGAVRRALPGILLRFLPLAAGLLGLTAWLSPDSLFLLVRERTGLWLMILCLYPLLSVLPQGIVFRSFFLHRYRGLIPDPRLRMGAAAAAFALAHIVFQNAVAIALTFLGGLMFLHTYRRCESGLAASLEHALYGCWVYTIGLGAYFYRG